MNPHARNAIAALALSALPLAALTAQPPPASRGWAIRNVTIVPVTGPRVEHGTVVIRDGKI